MTSNSAEFATKVIDCLYELPATDVLSLQTEAMDVESSAPSSPVHSSSALSQLPPIYGQEVSEEWIEAHTQLTREISSLRDQLLRQPPPSSKVEFASLSESTQNLAAQIATLQRGVESLHQFASQLARITRAADQIQEVSEKLAALSTDEATGRPLKVLQEVSENIGAICGLVFSFSALPNPGKFFYQRLVNYMIAGPIGVYVLAGESAVSKWRELIGPTKTYRWDVIYRLSDANTLDGDESAKEEIKFFFPDFDFTLKDKV
ncbi:Nucleoside diphosphate kinase 6 [Taenia solium]|eukprot:TsM_000094600 transcript=TsM_000094600 gene=TsM_000094600